MRLQNALLRLERDGPELQAIAGGEIDAVVDYAGSKVILLPAARRALREIADPAPAANSAAALASTANTLLAALPHAEYQRLLAGFEPVTLKFGELLQEPGVPIRHVYFPIDCVISLLTTVEGHHPLAVALVGPEGMVGIPLALGIDDAFHRALVQVSGTAMRMEAGLFRHEVLRSKPLRQALFRFEHALVGQISQCAACNGTHATQARLARYVLMTVDRAKSMEIRLGHDFLARALGVRRVGVTEAAGALKRRKLIKCGRGVIAIVDRRRLTAVSCACYEIVKRIYESAYAGR